MKKADCNILVEKLVSKIRCFGSKKLSYSGRLVLVNSVLTALYSYWINIFVIPVSVLNKLNAICRNYLWDGGADFVRVPMVGWEKVCCPKSEGGLGIRDSFAWNIAAIGKLVWWVYFNPDRLWVKWVNQVYLKGQDWKDYKPSGDLSWGWKSVCKVKDKLDAGYQNGQWLLDVRGYTLRSGYDLIRHKFQNVPWHKQIWNSWSLPKHQFIGWLIAREALMLKDKLFSLGIVPDDDCLLCGKGGENHTHLFQTCEYSRRLLDEVFKILRIALPISNPLQRIADGQFSQVQKGVILSAVSATFYHIWLQRNKARVDGVLQRPEFVRDLILKEMKTRIVVLLSQKTATSDNVWLRSRSLIV
ncbi:uncharacterized protein LOC141651472 [Silene latifolia]|uniref:uncharacterized protein LOC141651472 n=1 Tax=Silene latifolia TaxID=37657 RepID=UPI003D779F5B